jgi:hypothetical protein
MKLAYVPLRIVFSCPGELAHGCMRADYSPFLNTTVVTILVV